jgi:two-component sensor histidine kinase
MKQPNPLYTIEEKRARRLSTRLKSNPNLPKFEGYEEALNSFNEKIQFVNTVTAEKCKTSYERGYEAGVKLNPVFDEMKNSIKKITNYIQEEIDLGEMVFIHLDNTQLLNYILGELIINGFVINSFNRNIAIQIINEEIQQFTF